jgi:hypothetical protein
MFRGTTGTAAMVTDDRSGDKLPKHPVGDWVFLKEVELIPGAKTIGPPPEEAIEAIKKDGFYRVAVTMSVETKG